MEDPDVDGRIILGWIFRNGMWEHGLDRSGPRQGQVAGTCEYSNEPSRSLKYGEFLGWLLTGSLKKNTGPMILLARTAHQTAVNMCFRNFPNSVYSFHQALLTRGIPDTKLPATCCR